MRVVKGGEHLPRPLSVGHDARLPFPTTAVLFIYEMLVPDRLAMTRPNLASLIVRHMKKEGLDSVLTAAERIGVNAFSLRNVLKQSRKPNARTFPAYARFLGVTEDALTAQLGPQDTIPTVQRKVSAHGDIDASTDEQSTPGRPAFAALPLRIRERLRALSEDEMRMVGDFASWLVRRRPRAQGPVISPRRTEAGRLARARRIGRA